MVQPRLGILSTIDTELTRVSELVTAQDFSGGSWRAYLTAGSPPSGEQALLRVHGTVS